MKFFVHCLSLSVLVIGSTAFARADEASKMAKIEEMLALTHVDRMTQQIMAQMQPMMAEQMKKMNLPAESQAMAAEFQQKMMEWLSGKLNWDKLKPAYIKIYDETFTEQEIDGVVAFYKTPAGQALLNKMPQLMQKSMAMMPELMGDMPAEMNKIRDELAKKYPKQ